VGAAEINEKSTMHRSFLDIDDPTCPIQLSRVGVFTTFNEGNFVYRATGTILPSEPIVAFDVTLVLYDAFGDRIETLGLVRIADINAGEAYDLSPRANWQASEGEVTRLLTVVAFVSRVRTASGRVWRLSEKPILDEIQRVPLQLNGDIFWSRSEVR
jgi:hypothetical protein